MWEWAVSSDTESKILPNPGKYVSFASSDAFTIYLAIAANTPSRQCIAETP